MRKYKKAPIIGCFHEQALRVEMSGISAGDVLHVTQERLPGYEAILRVMRAHVEGQFSVSDGELALQYGKERITSVVQSATATDGSAIRPGTILVHDAKDIAASRVLDFDPNDVVSPDTIDNIAERKRAWGEWKS